MRVQHFSRQQWTNVLSVCLAPANTTPVSYMQPTRKINAGPLLTLWCIRKEKWRMRMILLRPHSYILHRKPITPSNSSTHTATQTYFLLVQAPRSTRRHVFSVFVQQNSACGRAKLQPYTALNTNNNNFK